MSAGSAISANASGGINHTPLSNANIELLKMWSLFGKDFNNLQEFPHLE